MHQAHNVTGGLSINCSFSQPALSLQNLAPQDPYHREEELDVRASPFLSTAHPGSRTTVVEGQEHVLQVSRHHELGSVLLLVPACTTRAQHIACTC